MKHIDLHLLKWSPLFISIVGLIIIAAIIRAALKKDEERGIYIFFIILVCSVTLIACYTTTWKLAETAQNTIMKYASEGYTIYLNGNTIEKPEYLEFKDYHIKIDEDNKAIILHE